MIEAIDEKYKKLQFLNKIPFKGIYGSTFRKLTKKDYKLKVTYSSTNSNFGGQIDHKDLDELYNLYKTLGKMTTEDIAIGFITYDSFIDFIEYCNSHDVNLLKPYPKDEYGNYDDYENYLDMIMTTHYGKPFRDNYKLQKFIINKWGDDVIPLLMKDRMDGKGPNSTPPIDATKKIKKEYPHYFEANKMGLI